MTPVWLFALVLTATPNPHLGSAEDLVAQVRYSDAEKSLALARAQPRNPRDTLIRILELQGIVAATLGQGPKARLFFQQMLSLDPDRKLAEGLPPRVRTPFYEAKGMVSEVAPMVFSAAAEAAAEGLVIRAKLSADPATLARKARFHHREVGDVWKVTDKPIAAGFATVAPGPGRFDWWVELLGEHEASLFIVGTEGSPFTDGTARAVQPVVAATPPVLNPPPTPSSDVPLVARPRDTPSSKVNPAVWVCFAGAGATAVGGIVAGVLSRSSNSQVDNAAMDSSGFVTGMTQREAAGLRDQARTQAIAANVLFGAAVALAGTGAAIWLLSGPSKVALVPSPGGLVVVGELP